MRVKSSRGARMFLQIAVGSGLLIANILIASVGGVSDAGRGGLFLVGGLYDAGSGRSGACLPVAAAGGDGGGQRAADLWPADRAVDRGAAADPSGAGRAYPQPQPCGRLDRRSG